MRRNGGFSGLCGVERVVRQDEKRALVGAAEQDLELIRMLLDDLEQKRDVIDALTAARDGEGVKVFIGSENRLFSLSGSSVIVAPYRDENRKIVSFTTRIQSFLMKSQPIQNLPDECILQFHGVFL